MSQRELPKIDPNWGLTFQRLEGAHYRRPVHAHSRRASLATPPCDHPSIVCYLRAPGRTIREIMYKISEFSKICRVPVKTLRYYDEIGLFAPAEVDRFTGYRYYSTSQMSRINRILALKDMGLSLTEIARLLDEQISVEELRGMFRLKAAEVHQEVEAAQARLARVAQRLKQIEEEGNMPEQDVVIKQIEPLRVLYLRQIAPTPQWIGKYMEESFAAIGRRGIVLAGPPLAIYYDEEYQEQDWDIAVALPIANGLTAPIPLDEGRCLTLETLPAIESAACIIHQGPYDTLYQSYRVLEHWIEENHYQLASPPREVYLSSPDDPVPVTEIQFPVKR